jgi:hypothetical protein
MSTRSLKFRRLDVTLGLVVFEEECSFCLTSILVAVAMTEKMTYKKKR